MGLETLTGSLAAGKSADFIVLGQPLQGQSPREIAETKVLRTVFEGNTVFEG